jgi:hypothetical protein
MQDVKEVSITNIETIAICQNYWIEERSLEKAEYTRKLRSAKQAKYLRTYVSKTCIKYDGWKIVTTTGVEAERFIEFLFSCGNYRSSAIYRHNGQFKVGSPEYEDLVRELVQRVGCNAFGGDELDRLIAELG